ncbi:hypothetical protein PR002_g850 [Phytophthora rubi]|uniref:No apical meristem-associated C-terminal domain-containing protein n=1 Tax=Phytophthora rubi TaxID=129364 RepID=A0A6A3NQN5_9STRA|nr:hypothetical protein PR002_g850 [Phytophthora rubi]
MGKGREWSESETIQLRRSWLEISEDAARGAGQKRKTFSSRLYNHWLENKSTSDAEARSEIAVIGRWKKMQPEVTKFCGVYSKLKSRERSGWSEEMYLDAAMQVYADRHKQPFEFLAAWKELKDMPKWTSNLTSEASARAKRKAGEDAAEKKASVMEQQSQVAIFMQDPQCDESKEYFALQRKIILEQLRKKTAADAGAQLVTCEEGQSQPRPSGVADPEGNKERDQQ